MRFDKPKKTIESIEIKGVIALYFLISLFLVFFDYFEINEMICVLKPMLLPILVYIYLNISLRINKLYLAALLLAFIANLLFIPKDASTIKIATYFYIASRILIFIIVSIFFDFKNKLAILLGSIPFFWLFTYLLMLTFSGITVDFLFFLSQAILMSILCGYAISKYVFTDDRRYYFLLMSCGAFALIECIFIIQYYYISVFIFKPIVVVLYSFGQYFFLKYILLCEEYMFK